MLSSDISSNQGYKWRYIKQFEQQGLYIDDILPKGPYPPCLRMADRALFWQSSNGNIFRVTGHLCGEFTNPWRIPHTKAGDAEPWCFLSSASEQTIV